MQFFNNFKPRIYQETIFARTLKENCLVVLPTGLGKTAISMMLSAARLQKYPESKTLILAPTRPLVNQHYETFKKMINSSFLHEDDMIAFTGAIPAQKRKELWQDAKIIFSTPQGLENDLVSRRISLEDVSLIVFDEAHRATGDYSYVWLAERYSKEAKHEKILALTASPGTDNEVIDLVCKNLHIDGIEFRDRDSPDVKPYVKDVDFNWIEVSLPKEFDEVLSILKKIYADSFKKVKNVLGPPFTYKRNLSKKDLLTIQGAFQGKIARGEGNPELYQAVSDTALMLKLQHAIELLETQGVFSTAQYLDDLWKEGTSGKTKAAKKLSQNPEFKHALTKIWKLKDSGLEHPKIPELLNYVLKRIKNKQDAKIIIFNNYRDSISRLKNLLDKYDMKNDQGDPLIRPEIFVGQAKKKGMGITQKEQLQRIEDFREGVYNILIMSSVGEEGLDIPAVDEVIFYEPVPSAIRQIQRAGRTGRQETGKVTIFIAKNTRDVAYRWSTHTKQKKMNEILKKKDKHLQTLELHDSSNQSYPQKTLQETLLAKKLKVIVDTREKTNRIVKDLMNMDYEIIVKQLDVADYILDEHTGIEFKTKKDFVDSLLDGRLFDQASTLARNFNKPLIVVQGEEDIYSLRNISPSAIIGAISSLATSFRIPVIFTRSNEETVTLFSSIIKRQEKDLSQFSMHAFKPKDDTKLQEYIITSFPMIGPQIAKNLLDKFKTIASIVQAKEEELAEVEGVGKIKAASLRTIFDKKYTP